MAVLDIIAANAASDTFRRRPIDDSGKLRFLYASFVNGVAAADINSTLQCGSLPPGTTRVLPFMSRVGCSAWGAARVLSVGHAAYRTKQDVVGGGDGIQAANYTAFASALDVSAALTVVVFAPAVLKYDIAAAQKVPVVAQVTGGTIPAAATLAVLLAYIYE